MAENIFAQVAERQRSLTQWLSEPAPSEMDGSTFDFSRAVSLVRHAVRIDGNQCQYDDPAAKLIETDTKKMSARFLVSSISKDRMGDVVIPQGCRGTLPHYQKNPRVFFGHKSYGFSIGSARTPDGMLALDIADDLGIYSTCYFHGQTRESEEAFRLVDNKELEAASIGFMPILGEVVKRKDEEEERPRNEVKWEPWISFIFKQWELYEWSIVAVPANADCIAMRLSRGIGGKRLSPGIERYLSQFAAPAREWANGFVAGKSLQEEKPALDALAILDELKQLRNEVGQLKTQPQPVNLLAPFSAPVPEPTHSDDSAVMNALKEILDGVQILKANQEKNEVALRRLTGRVE